MSNVRPVAGFKLGSMMRLGGMCRIERTTPVLCSTTSNPLKS